MTGRPLGDANCDSRVGVIPEVLPIHGKPYRLLLSGVWPCDLGKPAEEGECGTSSGFRSNNLTSFTLAVRKSMRRAELVWTKSVLAVIQPIRKADAGHMCMDDGTQWVSDFKQPL